MISKILYAIVTSSVKACGAVRSAFRSAVGNVSVYVSSLERSSSRFFGQSNAVCLPDGPGTAGGSPERPISQAQNTSNWGLLSMVARLPSSRWDHCKTLHIIFAFWFSSCCGELIVQSVVDFTTIDHLLAIFARLLKQ